MSKVKVEFLWNDGSDSDCMECPLDQSEIYKAIAKKVTSLPVFSSVFVRAEGIGSVCYDLKQRGTFVKNGATLPSLYVIEKANNLCFSGPEPDYPEVYLTCVNPESNNYKFYHMLPGACGIDAEYGRIGAEKGEMFGVRSLKTPYKSRLFWIRYGLYGPVCHRLRPSAGPVRFGPFLLQENAQSQ